MCGFPIVNIGGGAQSFATLGSGSALADQLVNQQTETIYDNASYIRGKHQFKFAIEFHHSGYHGLGAPGNFDGTLNFQGDLAFSTNGESTALQDFLAGKATNGSILVNPQSNSVGFNREAFYFSDDFRLTRTITMNLGLRYEIEPAILVDSNKAANFDPTQPTGNRITASFPGSLAFLNMSPPGFPTTTRCTPVRSGWKKCRRILWALYSHSPRRRYGNVRDSEEKVAGPVTAGMGDQ